MPNYPTSYGNVIIGGNAKATASTISITSPGSGYSNQVLTVSNGTGATSVPNWASSNTATMTAKGKLKVEGEEADIFINGKSMSDWMSVVERRLAILQPKPEHLENYEALQQLYDQYKTLEALIYQTPETK